MQKSKKELDIKEEFTCSVSLFAFGSITFPKPFLIYSEVGDGSLPINLLSFYFSFLYIILGKYYKMFFSSGVDLSFVIKNTVLTEAPALLLDVNLYYDKIEFVSLHYNFLLTIL
jgi:hypothetical protein